MARLGRGYTEPRIVVPRVVAGPTNVSLPDTGAGTDAISVSGQALAHWSLNDTSGTTYADDASGNHALSITGTPTFSQTGATALTGTSVALTAGNGQASHSSPSWLNGLSNVTFTAWFKTTASSAGGIIGAHSFAGVATNSCQSMVYISGGQVTFCTAVSNTNYFTTTSNTYNDGNWHRLVATRDSSGNKKIYIDNVLAASGTDTAGALNNPTQAFWLGRLPNSPSPSDFVGNLDDAGVFAYTFSTDQVASDFFGSGGTVALADSATGVDALTVTAQITLSDTGTGTDAISVTGHISLSDTGTGADGVSITAQVPLADTGSGTEDLSLGQTAISLSDTGSGSDTLGVAVAIGLTDTGSGADTVAITADVPVADTGSTADTLAVTGEIALADIGSSTDGLAVSIGINLADTGSGADSLTAHIIVPLAETGSATDALSVNATVPLAETGTAADALTVPGSNYLPDTGVGTENLTIVFNIPATVNTQTTVALAAAVFNQLVVKTLALSTKTYVQAVAALGTAYQVGLQAVNSTTTEAVTTTGGQLQVSPTVNSATSVTLLYTFSVGKVDSSTYGTLTVNSATVVKVAFPALVTDMTECFIGVQLKGTLEQFPTDLQETTSGYRTVQTTVLTMAEPMIFNGKPIVPTNWAKYGSTITLIEGKGHIEAIKDPNPIWDPTKDGWYSPPVTPPSNMIGRWTVDDLPDPPDGGYYWLGDPTSADGTAGYTGGRIAWYANGSTPHAPAWRSFFPYKPSVRAYNSYLPGGNVVHHPKGVHFNSHFIEHMYATVNRLNPPFTWVITAMIVNYPYANYNHNILDAGQSPDLLGVPRISADDCGTPRQINERLDYRMSISAGPNVQRSSLTTDPNQIIRVRTDPAIRPKMYVLIANGAHSYTGVYSTGGKYLQQGTLTSAGKNFSSWIIGRQQGWLSQDHASHIMVLEIRLFNYAMPKKDLDAQYGQLSSTYKFNQYRSL